MSRTTPRSRRCFRPARWSSDRIRVNCRRRIGPSCAHITRLSAGDQGQVHPVVLGRAFGDTSWRLTLFQFLGAEVDPCCDGGLSARTEVVIDAFIPSGPLRVRNGEDHPLMISALGCPELARAWSLYRLAGACSASNALGSDPEGGLGPRRCRVQVECTLDEALRMLVEGAQVGFRACRRSRATSSRTGSGSVCSPAWVFQTEVKSSSARFLIHPERDVGDDSAGGACRFGQ